MAEHGVGPAPRVLSRDFHLRFLPAVIWRRVRPQAARNESPFAHHLPIELPLMLAVTLVLASVGLPQMVLRHSIIGGIVGVIGTAGAVALVGQSIYAQRGTPLTFDGFRIMVFLFFVALGVTAGLLTGRAAHSRPLEVLGAATGLLVGYVVGVGAGLWVQRLGWVAAWVELAAGLSVVGLVVVDLTFMFG